MKWLITNCLGISTSTQNINPHHVLSVSSSDILSSATCFPSKISAINVMYVIANLRVSILESRFSYANVGTLFRKASNASFRLNILRRSRMFAALRCASVGMRRRRLFIPSNSGENSSSIRLEVGILEQKPQFDHENFVSVVSCKMLLILKFS